MGGRSASEQATLTAWAASAIERAESYWTAERIEALSAGRSLLLHPVRDAPLLRALGLAHRDGSIPPSELRKYWQVSHAVRILEPLLDKIDDRPIRLVDAGCGRSYLSLVLAARAASRDLRLCVLGVDRTAAVLREVDRRAQLAGLGERFRTVAAPLEAIDIDAAWRQAFGDTGVIHGVMALHACDTASCEAIALGISLNARWMAIAPCCQAELAGRWRTIAASRGESAAEQGAFGPIHRSPHLSRQIAAHVTDMLRTLLMRGQGWEVTPMEFVSAEHTPKNTLLRAVYTGRPDADASAAYRALVDATGGAEIRLSELLALRERSSRPRTTDR